MRTRYLWLLFWFIPWGLPIPTSAGAAPAAPVERTVCSCGRVHAGPCFEGLRTIEPGPSPASTGEDATPPIAAFRVNNRWTRTATDGFATGGQGSPITLTWGLVADGTNIDFGSIDNDPSGLINFLDNTIGSTADASINDPQQKSWFPVLESVFERWESISGLSFEYEPNDDGRTVPSLQGVLGVRPDLRLAGASIDGQSGANTLAFNAFPNNGDGVIDTDNTAFFGNPFDNFRALRNVLAHEIGHALGFAHLESNNSRQLLEPFINLSFDGPQLDDIRAAQRSYGDALERGGGNDTWEAGTEAGVDLFDVFTLGADADFTDPNTTIDPDQTDFVSIDSRSDFDFFRITADEAGLLDFRLKPVGPTYNEGPEGGDQTPLAANAQSRLTLTLLDANAQGIRQVNAQTLGETIEISDIVVEAGETIIARVAGRDANLQLYRLDVASNPKPNDGTRFDLTGDLPGAAPRSVTLFSGGVALSVTAEAEGGGSLAVGDNGLGVISVGDGILDPDDLGINGSTGVDEALLLSFDQTVLLENLELGGLDIGGFETAVLSLVSGADPFLGLEGYGGPYELGDASLSFSSPEWQSELINFAFGVNGQSPLLIEAGTVLSLSSLGVTRGGFSLASVTVTAVPEPAGVGLLSCLAIAACCRRGKPS